MLTITEEKNIDLPIEIISTVIISPDKKTLLIFIESKNLLYNYSLINNTNNNIKLQNKHFFPNYYEISNVYFSNLENNILLTKKNFYTIYQYNLNEKNFNYVFLISKFEQSNIENLIINPNFYSSFKNTFISIDFDNKNIKIWVNENEKKFLAIEIKNVLNVNYEPNGNYFITISNGKNNKNYMNIFLFEENYLIEKICNLEIEIKTCKDLKISKNKIYLIVLDNENKINLFFFYNCKLLKQIDLNDEYFFDVIILINNENYILNDYFNEKFNQNFNEKNQISNENQNSNEKNQNSNEKNQNSNENLNKNSNEEFLAFITKKKVFKLLKISNLTEKIEYKMPNTNFNLDYLQILDINNNKIWTIFFDEKKYKIFNYKI